MYPEQPVFVIDDEKNSILSMEANLLSQGIDNVLTCEDSRQVMDILENREVCLLLLDLVMPHVSGQQILVEVNRRHPHIPVIVVSGMDDIDIAISCIQQGAFDYVVKPFEVERLLPSLNRAIEVQRLRRENEKLSGLFRSEDLKNPEAFAAIKTQNSVMLSIFRYCEAIAEGLQPVLITGETGVGKELFAEAIHTLGGKGGEFVAVNVAGLDDQAFSDALFGHVRGAFTGADRDRPGLVSKAEGGTLFLDEIGDLNEQAQIKLLRFLEYREYRPSAPMRSEGQTPGCWWQQTGRSTRRFHTEDSGGTSTTGCVPTMSGFRRCASGGTTYRCCWSFLPPGLPRNSARSACR